MHLCPLKAGHHAELAGVDHVDGCDAVFRAQDPVEGRGGPAALDMAQDHRPGLDTGALLDLLGQDIPDAPQAHVAEGVGLLGLGYHPGLGGLGTLGHHHDGEVPPPLYPLLYLGCHLIHIKGLLRDEDQVRPPGDARIGGNPACVAPHDLHHHAPVVGLGGGVQPVDGLGGDGDSGIEAEGHIRSRYVVINGLGHPYNGQAHLVELQRHPQGVVPSDGHQGVQGEFLEVLNSPFIAALLLGRIGPGGMQNGPTLMEDAGQVLALKGHGIHPQKTRPAVLEAQELVAIVVYPLPHHRPDNSIQSRAVASPGQYTYPHRHHPVYCLVRAKR